MQWQEIKNEYINSDISLSRLAQKYSIKQNTLRYRAKKENWCKKKSSDPLTRITDIADNILDKIEIAVNQLNIYPLKKKTKTKFIEYIEDSGKTEKETIEEDEFIHNIEGIIDKNELKTLCSVLKELKSIYSNCNDENPQGRLEMLLKGLEDENIQ